MFENVRLYSSNEAFLLFFGAKIFLPFFVSSQLYAMSRVRNSKGNRWMAFFIFLMGVIFINDNEFFATFNISNAQALNRLLYIPLFSLPALFLYAVHCFAYADRPLTRKQKLLLIVPPAIELIPTISLFFISRDNLFAIVYRSIWDALFISYMIYMLYSASQIVRDHRRNIRDIHSTQKYVDMAWLKNVVFYAPIMLLGDLLLLYTDSSFFYDLADTMLLSFVAYLGWHIVQQRELHPQAVVVVDIIKTDRMDSEKQLSMALAISNYMQDRKPYVDVDLTMPQLAAMLNISNNDLSHILNNHFQENFYTYINRHRIEESKRIMSDSTRSNLSIEGIAIESGFRSKSTFYKWFKQLNGLSPNEYRAGGLT